MDIEIADTTSSRVRPGGYARRLREPRHGHVVRADFLGELRTLRRDPDEWDT